MSLLEKTIETAKANDQHYEVPTGFYDLVLGPYKKYSCGLWRKDTRTLANAEVNMVKAANNVRSRLLVTQS